MSMTQEQLEVLVDPETVRRSIKRIFTNTANEIIGELLQNSQRACASRVKLFTYDSGFTYEDNGNGLENGVESFHTLLAMAKSYFNNSTIEDQDPMGLGIHALIAHDSVQRVRFTSGTLSLLIDTDQWWSEPDYYKRWHERIETVERVNGFKIEVICGERLLENIKDVMGRKGEKSYYYSDSINLISAVSGYSGILDIEFNEKKVDTSVPVWCRPAHSLCTATYEGCYVNIGLSNTNTVGNMLSSVIWYGQVIKVPMIEFKGCGTMTFQVIVTAGHPFNPMSPSRRGMVMDEKMHKFVAWCKDEVFRQFEDVLNRNSPRYVQGLFSIDDDRACKELPVFLASELRVLSDMEYGSEEIGNSTGSENYLFQYDTPANVISPDVLVLDDKEGGGKEYAYGLCSVLDYCMDKFYTLTYGDSKRFPSYQIAWLPGDRVAQEDYPNAEPGALCAFNLPGSWCLMRDKEPGEFTEISERALIFAFEQQDSYNTRECNWVVGVKDVMDFFADAEKYGWNSDTDGDSGVAEDEYDESVADWRRSIIGNAFKTDFKISDTRNVFTYPEQVVKIDLEYPKEQNKLYAAYPTHATFTSNQGTVVRRTLMD